MPEATVGLDQSGFGRDVLSALIDATPTPAVLLEPTGKILLCNQAWRDFARQNGGEHPDYWVGVDYLGVCSAAKGPDSEGADEAAEGIRSLLKGGISQYETVYPCHAPWARRWFKMMARPMTRVRQVGAMIIHVDITDQMLANEALNIRERAVESVDEGICIADAQAPDFPIIYVNDAFQRITGYASEEVLGRNCRFLQGAETDPEAVETIRAGLKAGKPFQITLLNYRRDGEPFWNELRMAPVADETGTVSHYVGIQNDVTERIAFEHQLQDAKTLAEDASAAKSEFLSRVSHELRTPLNAVLGFSQLLDRSRESMPLTDKQAKWIDQIAKGGQHLLGLIDEILDLAKIESGVLTLSLERVRVQDLIDSCLDMTRVLADDGQITIDRAPIDPDTPDITADFTRVKQVLLNLLSNAVKYNKPGGRISITVEPRSDTIVRIAVADNGQGIPADVQSALFDPFNRLGAEESDVEGTGIGLAVTKKLVEAMDGTIDFESQKGRGSRFWVDLPVFDSQANGQANTAATSAKPATVSAPSLSTATLLYVEDNPTNLRLMMDILEDFPSVDMVSAHTAEFALNIAESRKPKLILMDLHLPGMNGTEALKRFRTNPSTCDIPVVALTAQAMPRDIEKGLAAGFDDYLTKPIDLNRLRGVLERHLSPAACEAEQPVPQSKAL